MTQLRFAVHKSRSSKDLCFANHLFVSLESEPQLIARTMADGQEISKKILEEIDRLTIEKKESEEKIISFHDKQVDLETFHILNSKIFFRLSKIIN